MLLKVEDLSRDQQKNSQHDGDEIKGSMLEGIFFLYMILEGSKIMI